MRGFTAAVARTVVAAEPGPACVAVGLDGDAGDRRIAIAVRHADGTILTLYLTDAGVDRLARMLADCVEGEDVELIGGTRTLQ